MPRRKRVSKRRRELTLAEILDETLPPSSLVRRGPDELDEELMDEDMDSGVGCVELDELDGRAQGGAT